MVHWVSLSRSLRAILKICLFGFFLGLKAAWGFDEYKIEIPESIKNQIQADAQKYVTGYSGALFMCKPFCELVKLISAKDGIENIKLTAPQRAFNFYYLPKSHHLFSSLFSDAELSKLASASGLENEKNDEELNQESEEEPTIDSNWSFGYEGYIYTSQKNISGNSMQLNDLNTALYFGGGGELSLRVVREPIPKRYLSYFDILFSLGNSISFNEKPREQKQQSSRSSNMWMRLSFPFTYKSWHIGPAFEYLQQDTSFSVSSLTGYSVKWQHSLMGIQLWKDRYKFLYLVNIKTQRSSEENYFTSPYSNDYSRLHFSVDLGHRKVSRFPLGLSVSLENTTMQESATPSSDLNVPYASFDSTFNQWVISVNLRLADPIWKDTNW